MDKKKTIKEMREEIKQMVEASKRRQRTTGGGTAMKAPNGKEYMGPARGEYKPAPKRDEKPRQRPGSGKERMMAKMEEERKRRKNGESAVVGS
jgi:hypothetical protein